MTYMNMLELLIPRVVRELFLSKNSNSITLALKLASPTQRNLLLGWYVLSDGETERYQIPYVFASRAIDNEIAIGFAGKNLWKSLLLEGEINNKEVRVFLKQQLEHDIL